MSEIEGRLRVLEHQATSLRAYLNTAMVVGGILGISGAWGFHSLSKVSSDLKEAQRQADTLRTEVKGLTTEVKGLTEQIAEARRMTNPDQIERTVKEKVNAVAKPRVETLARGEVEARFRGSWSWGGAYDRNGDQCVVPNPLTRMCECPPTFQPLDLVHAGVVFCYRQMP
jgi:cell division protein FtsB